MNPAPSALARQAIAALARGDADMLPRLRRARAADPGDPVLALAEAEAEFLSGEEDAGARLAVLVQANPAWVAGHRQLSSLRWERGDRAGFVASFEAALHLQPRNIGLWNAYIDTLAGSGEAMRAADAAAAARERGFDDPVLCLIEAQHAHEAGDIERATRLLQAVPRSQPDRAGVEARVRLASGDLEGAAILLDVARASNPGDLSLWAMTEIVWRATNDRRGTWLMRPAFVGTIDLPFDGDDRTALLHVLRRQHAGTIQPLHQSVRGGTQTRGLLFDRAEPEIARLRVALQQAVERHWRALPTVDGTHPLLRHRARRLSVGGGWSVRLTGGSAHHASHIHPAGVLSSACYIALPALAEERGEGALELGRPPASLRLDLPPLRTISPREGMLVLFPSYLYHGTRAFPAGERLTVAFDAT